MELPSPEFIPDAMLEQRAIDVLRKHERLMGTRVSLPIPIESIVEHTLALRIVWVPIEEFPDEIILARIDPNYLGHPTIQLNESRAAHFEDFFGTEAFSLGHEAGHWVLHLGRGRSRQLTLLPETIEETGAPLLCRRMSDGDRRELQADRISAYMLLPEYLLRPVIGDYDLTRWSGIAALARDCCVSKRAMARRLDGLDLICLGPSGELLAHGQRADSVLL